MLLLALAALPAAAASKPPPELERARALLIDARYAAAESLSREILAGIPGKDRRAPLDSAAVFEVLVETLWKNERERRPEALAFAERGAAIRERLGDRSPELAASLCQLSAVLSYTRKAKEAEIPARRAIEVAQRAGPAGQPAEALGWHTLGLAQYIQGQYPEARISYTKGLEIRERALPPDHRLIGTSLRALATCSHLMEEWQRSLDEWRRALANADRALRHDHPDRGRCLQGMSLVLYHAQEYAEAQRAAEEALEINEQNLGANHPQVAYACLSLGWNLGAAGDFGRAKSLNERAYRIFLATYGPDDVRTLDALDRVASVMIYNGDCAAALPIAEQVVATARRALGEDHIEVSRTLTTLAQAHECLGQVDEALAVVVEEARRAAAAPKLDIVMMASAARREARMRLRQGNPDSAIALLREALEIAPRRYGPRSPQILLTEEWLGTALLAKGEADSARRIFRRLVTTVESVEGRSSSAAAVVLARLAAAEAACGDSLAAIAAALRAETAGREAFRATARGFSEHEALAAATVRTRGLDLALAVMRRMTPPDSVALAVWDAVVRSRALVADEIAGRQAMPAGDDSLHAELLATRAMYARLLARGPAGADSIWRAQLEEVETRRDQAERRLIESSAAFRSERQRTATGVGEVFAALPAGTALVSYVRHSDGAAFDSQPMWTALVRGADGRLTVRPIGRGAEVDAVISEWTAELSRPVGNDDAGRAAEKRCRKVGDAARRLVWEPLASRLRGASRVVVVPDGALALGNLAALPAGKSGWLIESGPTLALVSAERDLVAEPPPARGASGLVAFGGIDYDAGTAPLLASAEGAGAASDVRGLVPCSATQELHFAALAGTKSEAEDVLAAWTASGKMGEIRTGATADEEAFRALAPRAQVLHLATHGFYLDPSCVAGPDSGTRGVAALTSGTHDLPSPATINPLRLSGLALAGANARLSAMSGADDGILTAGELAAIDLSSAELVTLSACESGRGQVFSGEGVLGLRRALRIAGARASLMTLWAVRDEPTRAWMADFYRSLWTEHRDLHEAVRSASRAALGRLRSQGRPTHPVDWAGMIAEGR